MTFLDIVSGLKVAEIRKIYSADNIAWILNCIPLPKDHETVLKNDLNILAQRENLSLHIDGEFIMVGK
jgi:hypothetical protein